MLFRRRKRRREIAELLQALLDKHPVETIHVAWDNAVTHEDEEVEAVVSVYHGLPLVPTHRPDLSAKKSRSTFSWPMCR